VSSVGPFSIHVIVLAGCALLAWLVARFWPVRQAGYQPRAAASIVVDAVLAGLVGARLAFVAMHWRDYAGQLWSMLALGDGGFMWQAGLICAALVALLMTRRRRPCRGPVLVALALGALVWVGASAVQQQHVRSGPGLDSVAALTVAGERADLRSTRGQPVVVNLWASWCAPCRRELPAFVQAQQTMPGVTFAMLNQGETAEEVNAFLHSQGLELANVYRDPDSATMHAFNAQVLPTTLFFDRQGRLLDIHVGELTLASLRARLRALTPP